MPLTISAESPNYIQAEDPRAAARVASRIFARTMSLATLPQRGRMGRIAGTRELLFLPLPYIAVYRVVGEQVRILRIRHAAQQWPRP